MAPGAVNGAPFSRPPTPGGAANGGAARSSANSGPAPAATSPFRGRSSVAAAAARRRASEADEAAAAAAIVALDASAAADAAVLHDWALEASSLRPSERRRLLGAMFHSMGLFTSFGINPLAFASFVSEVEAHYADCPFHNFLHAWNVTHAGYMLLQAGDLRAAKLVGDLEVLALLTAVRSAFCSHRLLRSARIVRFCLDVSDATRSACATTWSTRGPPTTSRSIRAASWRSHVRPPPVVSLAISVCQQP